MSIVPNHADIVSGDDGIYRSVEGYGSTHPLPMNEKQLAKVAKRKRFAFGFQQPTQGRSKKGKP